MRPVTEQNQSTLNSTIIGPLKSLNLDFLLGEILLPEHWYIHHPVSAWTLTVIMNYLLCSIQSSEAAKWLRDTQSLHHQPQHLWFFSTPLHATWFLDPSTYWLPTSDWIKSSISLKMSASLYKYHLLPKHVDAVRISPKDKKGWLIFLQTSKNLHNFEVLICTCRYH